MEIIRNNEIVEDGFTHVDDEAPLPAGGNVLLSLRRWIAERVTLRSHEGKIGIRVAPDDELAPVVGDLDQFDVVAIEFPKFTDGRGYSKARLLRDRHGFRGELRAVGHVLRDQLFYMARCGINAFEMYPGKSLPDALVGLSDFSVTYQAAADESRPIYRRGVR